MRYWYKLMENNARELAKREGGIVHPITLYPQTEEICQEHYSRGGWWLLGECTDYGDWNNCEFDSLEDAEKFFYLLWDGDSADFKAFSDELIARG